MDHHAHHSVARLAVLGARDVIPDVIVDAKALAELAVVAAVQIAQEFVQRIVHLRVLEDVLDAAPVVQEDAQTAVRDVKEAAQEIATVTVRISAVIRARQIAAAVVLDVVHPVVRDARAVQEVVLDAAEPAVLAVPVAQVPAVLDVRLDVGHPAGIAAHQLVLGATVHATALALDAAAVVIPVRQIAVHRAAIHAKMSASERHQHQF